MADFYIKQNDTLPSLEAFLKDVSGGKVDLTNAVSVVFTMADADDRTVVKINKGTATIVNPTDGKIRYDWVVGDTDTVGGFHGEFEVDWGGGGIQTFPSRGFIDIEVVDDIA